MGTKSGNDHRTLPRQGDRRRTGILGSMDLSRERALALDAADPLRTLRDQFSIAGDGLIYLDGNSLGRLPRTTVDTMRDLIERQWGTNLIRGWHDWVNLPLAVGAELAAFLGADRGQIAVCDSTTVNLYKGALAVLRADPARPDIITDDDNFPTDRFVLAEIAASLGGTLRIVNSDIDNGVDTSTIAVALDDRVGLVSLSHVAYRSGAIAAIREIDALAHAAGARTLWDLSHSAGSIPVDLSTADLAVGCTYKYLNGGPGAPGYLYVSDAAIENLDNPIPGWFSAADQFAMAANYSPRSDVGKFLTGTPDVAGLLRVRAGIGTLAPTGIDELAGKGRALTSYLCELVTDLPVRIASPVEASRRGAHVVLEHPRAWQLSQALIARGVIPDYRTPDRLRLGCAAAYTRFVDIWDGVSALREILARGDHLKYPAEAAVVT